MMTGGRPGPSGAWRGLAVAGGCGRRRATEGGRTERWNEVGRVDGRAVAGGKKTGTVGREPWGGDDWR